MGDKYLGKESVRITVCFNGKEKKIPLVVQPSPQLSEVQCQLALESVTRLVQQIFKIVDSRNFTLRDSYSYNKLTKSSFRQENFPLKWNVVFDKQETMLKHGGVVRTHYRVVDVIYKYYYYLVVLSFTQLYAISSLFSRTAAVLLCTVRLVLASFLVW